MIEIICPGNIWSSEPVAYTCTIGYRMPKLCTMVKSLTLLNDTVSVNDVSGCGIKYPLLSSNLKISY